MSYVPNPVIATGSTTSRALADRLSDSLNAKDFGVTANGVTDDSAALAAWWSAINTTGKVGILPAGTILCNTPVVWNISAARAGGLRVEGPSVQGCVIDVRNAPATADNGSGTGTQFLISSTTNPAFYSVFTGFTVLGNNTTGPSVRLGRFNLADEFNGFRFADIEFKNAANAAGAIACEINGFFNCDFMAVTTNTGGARVAGTSLRMRYSAFCRYFGSFSGAGVGVLVDGTFSFSNVFTAINVEEVDVGVRFAGSSNSNNLFTGGTIVANQVLEFQVGSGANNTMLNVNFAPYLGGQVGTDRNGLTILGVDGQRSGRLDLADLSVRGAPGQPGIIYVDGDNATQDARMAWLRGGSLRWLTVRNSATEPGDRTGSELVFTSYNDVGASAFNVLTLDRRGKMTIQGESNGVNITGGATGFDVGMSAIGGDTNITLNLISKGSGGVQLQAGGENIIVALPAGATVGKVGGTLGFYGEAGTARPTITGAKGGNAALGSLLTALSNLGIITDATT